MFTITVRGRLKGNPENIRLGHDEQARAGGREQALALGELHHQVFLNPSDSREVLMIDQWKTFEAFQKFSGNPQIKEFFSAAFEGEPEITVWTKSNWMEW